jgi:hypothetical protein
MSTSYTVQSVGTIALVALLVLGLAYLQPKLFKSSEGFQSTLPASANYAREAGQNSAPGTERQAAVRSNPNSAGGDVTENGTGPAQFGNAESPAGCYPRDQLTPGELLPKDANSTWAQQNPMGTGSLKGKNFLSAGALVGVNTVGQSLRNANWDIRSAPPNPQVEVSPWLQSTIAPDLQRRPLDIA